MPSCGSALESEIKRLEAINTIGVLGTITGTAIIVIGVVQLNSPPKRTTTWTLPSTDPETGESTGGGPAIREEYHNRDRGRLFLFIGASITTIGAVTFVKSALDLKNLRRAALSLRPDRVLVTVDF